MNSLIIVLSVIAVYENQANALFADLRTSNLNTCNHDGLLLGPYHQRLPCGPHSNCKIVDDHVVCSCREGNEGSPRKYKCVDPCQGTCGINAWCQVINHIPLCLCKAGHTGDPFVICQLDQGSTFKSDDRPQIGKELTMKTLTVTSSDTTPYIAQRDITFKADIPRTPQENIESTTIKSSVVATSVWTSITVTLVVTSSLLSLALVLFTIVAIWKRCWVKPSPRAPLGLPTNHPEPFYQNMLFRKECDQEIAEIEHHHYEEIGPPRTKRTPPRFQ